MCHREPTEPLEVYGDYYLSYCLHIITCMYNMPAKVMAREVSISLDMVCSWVPLGLCIVIYVLID